MEILGKQDIKKKKKLENIYNMIFEISSKKGQIGEDIFQEFMEGEGWIVYKPDKKDKPHYFDMMCTFEKEKAVAFDVKTKTRLKSGGKFKFDAQGFDKKHFEQYLNFTKKINIPFFVIFIDSLSGDVMCINIEKLKKLESIEVNKDIIAWYVKDMQFIFKLTAAQIDYLSKYTQK